MELLAKAIQTLTNHNILDWQKLYKNVYKATIENYDFYYDGVELVVTQRVGTEINTIGNLEVKLW